jgi:hypothetical protein
MKVLSSIKVATLETFALTSFSLLLMIWCFAYLILYPFLAGEIEMIEKI